jgi:hypothetical protein
MEEEDRKALALSSCSSSSSSLEPSMSIAERRAAKCGFNAHGIVKSALFRTAIPLASLAARGRSPRLNIPPGISPAALLDSPIMLPNTQVSFLSYLFISGCFDGFLWFFFFRFSFYLFLVYTYLYVYVHIYVSVRMHVLICVCFVVRLWIFIFLFFHFLRVEVSKSFLSQSFQNLPFLFFQNLLFFHMCMCMFLVLHYKKVNQPLKSVHSFGRKKKGVK